MISLNLPLIVCCYKISNHVHLSLGQQTLQHEHWMASLWLSAVQSAHISREKSSTNVQTSSGISPVKVFSSNPRPPNCFKLENVEGISPDKRFWNKYNCFNSAKSPRHDGRGPNISLASKKSASNDVKLHRLVGMRPWRLLSDRYKPRRVLLSRSILVGMVPVNWLELKNNISML